MNVPLPSNAIRLAFLVAATSVVATAQSLSVSSTAQIGAPLVLTVQNAPPATGYVFDLGFDGSTPGLQIPGTGRWVPLNTPWHYLELGGITRPDVFAGFHGNTDANGRATAVLHLPPLKELVGQTFHTVCLTTDQSAPFGIGHAIAGPAVSIGDDRGWTDVAPSVDTRFVHVSTSGNDANNGLSPQQAVRTVARGKSLVRHGFPDRLLFRRGDVFGETIGAWQKSGRSASEPMVIGTYGTGARPVFRAGTSHGITFTGGGSAPATIDHVTLQGLHFWADGRDPGSATFQNPGADSRGLLWLRPGRNLTIEDCVFRFFGTNMVIQGEGTGLRGLTLRRSILSDSYGIAGSFHSQGFYMWNGHDVVIEENLFDHNGWHGGVAGSHPTIFGHNLYIHWENSNVVVRRNLIARAGSHGLQLRSGGTITDNVFVRNPIGLLLGGDYDPHPSNPPNLVAGNVVVQGTDIDAANRRGWGMEIKRVANPTVRDNLVARCEGGLPSGIQLTGLTSCTIANNTLWSWNGGNLASQQSLAIQHNLLSQAPAFSSNVVCNTLPFADTSRTVASYDAALGGAGTLASFLTKARQQARGAWLPAYTAEMLGGYLRAGFRPVTNLGAPLVGAVPY